MIRQEKISLIALIVSVAGLAMLFWAAENLEAKEIKIDEIDKASIGQYVKIDAQIVSYYNNGNTAFMQLYDGTGKLKAVSFQQGEQKAAIGKNSFASFEGKIELYKNELELVVEKVNKWN